jgi:hypothetical protein
MDDALQYSLGDDDIRKLLGSGIKITSYAKMDKHNHINELLDGNGRGVIFYPQQNEQQGHWTALIRKGREIEFFDPYGEPPDTAKHLLSQQKLEKMNMDQPHLLKLLKESGCRIIFNKVQLQELADDVATCGRHIVSRLLYHKYPLRRYREILRRSGTNPDEFVVKLTYKELGK